MSERRTRAAETLARHGIDAAVVDAGGMGADDVAARLGADVVAALGDLASPGAAALLAALDAKGGDRTLRKEIRRALYRLRQRGVNVPEQPVAAPAPSPASAPAAEGFVSGFDSRGDRVVWIVRALSGGGSLLVDALVNEPDGLREVHVAETSRKRLREVRRRIETEAKLRLIPADWRVLDALLVEGHARGGGESSHGDYLRFRPRLTAEPPASPAEPVSSRVAVPSAEESAQLVAASAALLQEPALAGWYPTPEAAAPYVTEIAGLRDSPLVLSQVAQQERVREVLRRAAGSLFPPAVLARRLEGTAYVLAETGRGPAARQALAVAQHLRARPADALELPFVTLLVERAVGSLLAESSAREDETRRGSLVVTPGQFLRDRSSSRPGRTRG